MLPIQNHAIAWTNAYLLSDQTYVKFGSVYKKKKKNQKDAFERSFASSSVLFLKRYINIACPYYFPIFLSVSNEVVS